MIGRELIRQLLQEGCEVICFDLTEQFLRYEETFKELKQTGRLKIITGTILDRVALEQSLSGVDVVVHLAAMLGVRKTEENMLRCLELNFSGTDSVIAACVLNKIEHLIFASSSEIYGEPDKCPVSETADPKGKSVYAVSKLAAEKLLIGYNQLYPSLNYTIIRFFNTYGEGQVAQFVLSKFVEAVLNKRNPVVYGTGSQRRSFAHVEDIARGLVEVIRQPKARNKTYNLGNDTQVLTLVELAEKVIEVLEPNSGLSVDISGTFENSDRIREREIFERWCSTERIRQDLGYVPKIAIEEGIHRVADAEVIHSDWPTPFDIK